LANEQILTIRDQQTLSDAIACHQQGNLDQATRIYQCLLEANPGNADAVHLLGVAALQRGDAAGAVELIGRAVALNPGEAAFHSNLAEAYRALGQFDRASGCCRTALWLQPNSAEAANNLGLILLARGNTSAAIAQFKDALRVAPQNAMTWNNLGNALRLEGDKLQAIAHFRQALERDPSLAAAHCNLGQLLLEEQQLEEALSHCREAARLKPDFPDARNNLGNVLRAQGQPADARACYVEALRLNPDLALTHRNMGQALQQENRPVDALVWYDQALSLDPGSARAHCYRGSALEELEKADQAGLSYEKAVQFDPGYAEAHNGLGWVRHEQGDLAAAVEHYQAALGLKPDLMPALLNVGLLRVEQGDFPAAEHAFREVLRLVPHHPGALSLLAMLLRGKLPAADEAVLRDLPADPHTSEVGRRDVHFAVAHLDDSRGIYDQAAEHLYHANALALADARRRGKDYQPAEHTHFVDQILSGSSPAFFERVRGFGLESSRPIFIVGLPRSGTTLTEQILASHSRVFGAGELRLGRQDFDGLAGTEPADITSFAALEKLDRGTVRRLGQGHLDRLACMSAMADHVVDKMPDNYLFLGLLATLFPRARFIHCRRDLRDTAVSCWMTNFRSIPWANDAEHIARRFHDYERLMVHWGRVLPVPLLHVDYEETVADLKGTAQRLLAWCGLEWEPACLAFYRTKQPIRTASVTQVRQPIYQRAVARWKHYEHVLDSLFSQLPRHSAPLTDDNSSAPPDCCFRIPPGQQRKLENVVS
jgi:tetratricopeptide (TPR) repeat protein